MKALITGVKGQLGFEVCKRLDELHVKNRGVDLEDFDLTDARQTMAAIVDEHPDCVIHCAAYTNVNKAQADRAACFAVNVEGTRNVASACREVGASMMLISTDYVFNGQGEKPFLPDAPKAPLNVYGESKLMSEQIMSELLERFYIVRTSWVFGHNGANFVKTMLRLGREKEQLSVVDDQIGSPTYARDLAILLCELAQTNKFGVYHATNEGFCSWYEFAEEIMRLAGLPCKLMPVPTRDYPSPAERPLNSRLSKACLDAAGLERLPYWRDALRRYLVEEHVEIG